MEEKDTYRTISKPSEETLFKEKGSKFFGTAFPVKTEDEVARCLETVKEKHKSARHFCYAYQLGTNQIYFRVNDDGEPSNSAGMPIYGQIQSFDLTDVLVVVVRYFGGTKLGVGGLISAYKASAKMTLDKSKIIEKTIDITFEIGFDYKNMNKVMRVIKEKNLNIIDQKLELDCKIFISVRKSLVKEIRENFNSIYEVSIKEID
ncbi:MAG: YigZ family protein [Flavobacteriaceae bacterium]|nr:YigZ family protein [Flavobacteriaceae bacterium]